MRKLTTLILGLSMVLGSAGLSLAAQETKKDEKKPAVAANANATNKKKNRKHKKHAKAAATPSTPSTATPEKK